MRPTPRSARRDGRREGDYRRIAERRVRLGLLLSEIGQANGIEISQAEMNMLVQRAAQQYDPKDRERFVQYLQQEPMAAAQLRAPLYEDKVVDFLVLEGRDHRPRNDACRTRSRDRGEEAHVHGPGCGHDHGEQPVKAKKAAAPKNEKAVEAAPAEAKPAAKAKKLPDPKAEAAPADKPAKKAPAKKKA